MASHWVAWLDAKLGCFQAALLDEMKASKVELLVSLLVLLMDNGMVSHLGYSLDPTSAVVWDSRKVFLKALMTERNWDRRWAASTVGTKVRTDVMMDWQMDVAVVACWALKWGQGLAASSVSEMVGQKGVCWVEQLGMSMVEPMELKWVVV